jgi:hypothetical protein
VTDPKKLARLNAQPFELVERRAARRVPLELPIDVRVEGAATAQRCTSVNLSTSGVFVSCATPPPVGAVVHVEMHSPAGLVQAVGKVMRAGPAGAGIQFTDLSREANQAIGELTRDR